MKKYFYLSAIPESLVASHLPPQEFGNYLAVGTRKRTRGQAIFFEVDPEKVSTLPWDYIEKKLVPYQSGEPKRSVYLSIYRVMENIPIKALKCLYLVTDDGKVLEIESKIFKESSKTEVHLYQQFTPITTRVASKLTPPEFVRFLTDPSKPIFAPRAFFVEMHLHELATDPQAPIHNLPYPNPDHLRDCLIRLGQVDERQTKTVLRYFQGELCYRTVKDGFFIGDQSEYLFYPFPTFDQLEHEYYDWWRSALVQCF
jgi:hypothetical protein